MRALKIILVFVLPAIILLCSSCRKDDPQPQSGTPLFHASGLIGGQPFVLEAGVNNYYMYSSCPSDANTVYEYTGELKPHNCTSSCPSSLVVRIRDYRNHISSPTSADTALMPGLYNFRIPSSSGYMVSFTPVLTPGDTAVSYTWSSGATNSNPTITFPSAGNYPVSLYMTLMHNNALCVATVSDTVRVGTTPCMNLDFTTVDVDQSVFFPGDSLDFIASVTGGLPPYSYSWNFGDSNVGTGNNTINGYNTPATYFVTLHATDANGCEQWRQKNVKSPHGDSAIVNFNWQQLSGQDLSMVEIEWTDAGGNLYSSAGGTQPVGSSFEIISAEEYQPNENHEPTKKVHMVVNCTLFNGSNTLLLQNADIVFAVAHH